MKLFRLLLAAFLLSSVSAWALAQDRVVYHFDDATTQAFKGLRSIRNHLDGEPSTEITVVALGPGIDFMMRGFKDSNASDYEGQISALKARGVKFEVCENTMKGRVSRKISSFPTQITHLPE